MMRGVAVRGAVWGGVVQEAGCAPPAGRGPSTARSQPRPAVLAVLALLVRLDVELAQLERKRHLLFLLLLLLDALGHRRRRGGQRRRRRLDVRRRRAAVDASAALTSDVTEPRGSCASASASATVRAATTRGGRRRGWARRRRRRRPHRPSSPPRRRRRWTRGSARRPPPYPRAARRVFPSTDDERCRLIFDFFERLLVTCSVPDPSRVLRRRAGPARRRRRARRDGERDLGLHRRVGEQDHEQVAAAGEEHADDPEVALTEGDAGEAVQSRTRRARRARSRGGARRPPTSRCPSPTTNRRRAGGWQVRPTGRAWRRRRRRGGRGRRRCRRRGRSAR